jgi:hypothetical protein
MRYLNKQAGCGGMCLSSQLWWEAQIGGLWFKVSLGQKCETLPEKIIKPKKGWGVAQVVEHLPNNQNSLSSNSSTVSLPPKKGVSSF